ncbi:MAG: hypothetical protein O3C40_17605 [Planctomycetota bacterium]|nr:hypothetical protein [Planctomycetota bacterium]
MPYASHRIVGVMELEATCPLDDSNPIRTRHSLAARATAAVIRRIGFELADSRSTPPVAGEPTVKVDSATLQRELAAELASLLANSVSVALN